MEPTLTLLSQPKIDETRIEVWHIVQGLPTNRLLQLMGMINCYTYSLTSRWGAIASSIDEEKTVRTVMKERLMNLASSCAQGLETVTTTVLWMRDYLKKYWVGACNSCPSIRKMRELMRARLNLFNFTPQRKGETVVPPEMQHVDIERMLVTFEVCERELLSRQVLSEGEEVGSELTAIFR